MSQPVTFEPGIRYVLLGESYQVIQVLNDGMLVAKNLATNTHISHQISQLWHYWQAQTLEFSQHGTHLLPSTETLLSTPSTIANLADLPPRLQEITWHRYQLIRPLMTLPSRARTQQVVERRIQEYRSSLDPALTSHTASDENSVSQRETGTIQRSHTGLQHPQEEQSTMPTSSPQLAPLFDITPRTVARWIHRYIESHEDIRSLVPSYHTRGPRHNRLSPLLQSLLQQAIKETYLTNVRAPVTHVVNAFLHLIATENATRAPEEHLKAPGKMTVYRAIHQLDAAETDMARLGRAQAGRIHQQTQIGPRCTRPNQRAELDFARLDLMVVDAADRLPIGRPTIAAIRDKYTGYLLGIFISFDPPSYRVAMECMLYAFLPKEHVKAQFHTQHEYLAFGIPEVLVVDNAIELHRDLELACLQLGIELQHMPVRTPWFKGSIERWFRTLNEDLIHSTPGTTFSHFLERGDYDSQKHACITLDSLWELLHVWIVDVYTQEVHSGVGGRPRGKGIPAQLWQQALEKQFIPRLPPSRNDLLVLVSRTTTRKLHHYGIEFEHLLYQDPNLSPLRSKLKRARTYRTAHGEIATTKHNDIRAGIVHIKYHPGDLSRIWVCDPFSDQYLEVRAVDQDYTDNLSLWKHRVITRYAHEELKRQVNQEALVQAKARIQQLITEHIRLSRAIRSRQSMARWWNTQVTTWINESTLPTSPDVIVDDEDESNQVEQSSSLESSRDHRFLSTTTTVTRSVADISAPLPDARESVVLLPNHRSQESQTPFEPFPPLPFEKRSLLTTKRSPRQRATSVTRPRPEHTDHTDHPSIIPSPPDLASVEHEDSLALPHLHVTAESEHPSSDSSKEDTSTIEERQQSFGIQARSTQWL
jgi:putative transposase